MSLQYTTHNTQWWAQIKPKREREDQFPGISKTWPLPLIQVAMAWGRLLPTSIKLSLQLAPKNSMTVLCLPLPLPTPPERERERGRERERERGRDGERERGRVPLPPTPSCFAVLLSVCEEKGRLYHSHEQAQTTGNTRKKREERSEKREERREKREERREGFIGLNESCQLSLSLSLSLSVLLKQWWRGIMRFKEMRNIFQPWLTSLILQKELERLGFPKFGWKHQVPLGWYILRMTSSILAIRTEWCKIRGLYAESMPSVSLSSSSQNWAWVKIATKRFCCGIHCGLNLSPLSEFVATFFFEKNADAWATRRFLSVTVIRFK